MSLQTPDAIRTLQRKRYGKAKAEPGYRFYLNYDKIWRIDILRHAYHLACANDGAQGVDGVTFDQIEAAGPEDWLARLGEELSTKTYRCQPVRRVMIPKPGGGERPLGIPLIMDRVVQTAAKLVLEPILEADLDPAAYGYRPARSAGQAIRKVLTLLRQGYTDLVDADLSKYFDTIPHQDLMRSPDRRVVDADMLRLVKQWLKAPVETTRRDGRKRLEGAKRAGGASRKAASAAR
jgi:RNA-directed DNA polymerase